MSLVDTHLTGEVRLTSDKEQCGGVIDRRCGHSYVLCERYSLHLSASFCNTEDMAYTSVTQIGSIETGHEVQGRHDR